jgi:hypothetical protein
MSLYPRPVRPSRAIGDFIGFVRARKRSEIWFGLLAVAITLLWFVAIFYKLYPEPEYIPPKVQYAKQWPASRTAEEVRAQQAKDLPRELAAKKALEAAKAAERAKYDRLAKQFGLDD